MPIATSPLAINDGSTTPVAVSYSLEEKKDGVITYVDRRLAGRDLNPEITSNLKRPNAKARTYNRTVEVRQPVVRVINGVDTVVDVNKVFVTHVISKMANEQERKHLDAMALNFCGAAVTKDQVAKLEGWL